MLAAISLLILSWTIFAVVPNFPLWAPIVVTLLCLATFAFNIWMFFFLTKEPQTKHK